MARSAGIPDNQRARRIRRHLALGFAAVLATAIVYATTPPPDTIHRLSLSTAYASLAFLAATLWLGPWNILHRRLNPVSSNLRRDIGIWAGSLALVHTAIGLNVHLRGHMWRYFFTKLDPLTPAFNAFGFANYVGLAATLLFIMLLAISNNRSLGALGARRWKSLQRWTYAAAILTVLHGVVYQHWVESRGPLLLTVSAMLVAIPLLIQLAGIARFRASRRR